jgi:hypothetical protein
MADRRLHGAAVVAAAMLLMPSSVLAVRPVKATTCTVSSGVTVGYANAPEGDIHLSCEEARVAVSGG